LCSDSGAGGADRVHDAAVGLCRPWRPHGSCSPAGFLDGQRNPSGDIAGSVAEEILESLVRAAPLDRAYVNNGGDIALHLTEGEAFTVGLIDRPDKYGLMRTAEIRADDPIRGIATSGWHGRSFSLGIADAVTVLAKTASQADAAATIIANAVDLPGHPAILRIPAHDLRPDSDLGARLVTRGVGRLSGDEVAAALDAGAIYARALLAAGLIDGAALRLCGETVLLASRPIKARESRKVHQDRRESAAHV